MTRKNKAINAVEYTGIVTLSQYIGEKKIQIAKVHNAGSYSLFSFFADCLVGSFDVARMNRPTKIRLLSADPENPGNYIAESGFIHQTTNPEKVYSTSKGTVRYSFLIPRDIVSGTNAQIDYIGLYANSATEEEVNEFSAIVGMSVDSSAVTISSAALVEWELNISNKNKETE